MDTKIYINGGLYLKFGFIDVHRLLNKKHDPDFGLEQFEFLDDSANFN